MRRMSVLKSRRWRYGDGLCERLMRLPGAIGNRGLSPIVRLEGRVVELLGEEEKRAQQLYGAKFPALGPLAKVPPAVVKALAKVRWYRLVPEHLHFIDNSQGFGHREEIGLGQG